MELRDSHGAKVRLLVRGFDHGLDRIRVLLRSERHIRIAPIGSHLLEMIILERGTAIEKRGNVLVPNVRQTHVVNRYTSLLCSS